MTSSDTCLVALLASSSKISAVGLVSVGLAFMNNKEHKKKKKKIVTPSQLPSCLALSRSKYVFLDVVKYTSFFCSYLKR